MNCSTCLVLVITFFTLLAHADVTHNEEDGDQSLQKEGDGTDETENTTKGPSTEASNATTPEAKNKTLSTAAAPVTENIEEETTKAINGSNAGCGSLSFIAVCVMVL